MAGEFDLHHLLAGPIIAMNDAQADAAASFYELFEQFAFEPPGAAERGTEAAPRRLQMISFIAERATAEGVERRQISMPLLQMIPIGGVVIDTAKIQFALAVNAEAPAARAQSAAPAAAERAVALKARIAPTAASEAAAGNLQVEIVLKQMDLPAGYLDMLAETQGGMSRRVAGAAASPAPDSNEEAVLFDAAIGEASAAAIAPGQVYEATLAIEADRRLVGPEGLALSFAGEPPRLMKIVAPEGQIRLRPGDRSVRVRIAVFKTVAKLGPTTEVALLIEGSATGPDGYHRRHRVRLVLPRAQAKS